MTRYGGRVMTIRLAIAALGLAACAGPQQRTFSPGDRAAVTTVLTDQEAAWNRGDLEAFMAGYWKSPSLVFTSGSQIRRGWQETFDKYRARYGGKPETMGHLSFEILDIQPLGADGVVVLGRWLLTATPNAGSGVFSVVLARRSDGWRVVHDHTSLDPAPAPAPEPNAPPGASHAP
jgi:ketosteroid isomerase-like protein